LEIAYTSVPFGRVLWREWREVGVDRFVRLVRRLIRKEQQITRMNVAIGMLIPPRIAAQGIESVVTWARDVGLGALDLPEDFARGAELCREHGLRVGAVNGAGMARLLSKNERTREQAVSRLEEQIRAMPTAGARTLFLCLVPEDRAQPIAESLAIFRDTFPSIAATCEQSSVRIVFEGWPGPAPHYPTLGYTPEQWRAMFAAVPSSALGLNYDPSHLVRLGIDYMRVLEEFSERIYHCHGKDTALLAEAQYRFGHFPPALGKSPAFSEGGWRYCVPGDGAVDWNQVAYALSQIGYDGCVSIELEDARYWGTVELEQQGITRAYQHLARHFL
jgi:sugar phosphate isomerase/epimerase